jgi:hypothetical protein
MIPLELEFEAACAVGCWRRGVAMQRPLWCWLAQRRYLRTRIAGRTAGASPVVRTRPMLRLATRHGVRVEATRS